MPTRPLTREQRKAQTRTQLLDAARKVFVREGFFRASVEELAWEARFTTGAVYSAFGGKSKLLLVILDPTHGGAGEGHDLGCSRRPLARIGGSAGGAILGRNATSGARVDPPAPRFWVYAAREPALHHELATRHRRVIDSVVELMTDAQAPVSRRSSALQGTWPGWDG